MKMAVLRMADDHQDVQINAELVLFVFATREAPESEPLKTQTSVMMLGGTVLNVEGGLERVVGVLRAAR